MAERITYHEENDIKNTLRLRELLRDLPPFVGDYFRARSSSAATRTHISYAQDIHIFFEFLIQMNPVYKNYTMQDFRVEDLDRVTARDIDEYMEFLKVYNTDARKSQGRKNLTNGEKGLKRKMSSLRTFYAWYFRQELIRTNPTVLIEMPKIHEKAIVRLDSDEVALLLDHIENCGATLTGQAKKYHDRTVERDLALITLLLGTGIRVSECVGLDIEDLDFKNNCIRIVRKGGNEANVYFGSEVEQALNRYLSVREGITPVSGHEHALFYSTQRKRMNVRSVENLVKKYASGVTTTKRITPHKLRSTYGTALYQETGDIYLVADVLGHKDVNTTRKHYAALDESRRRQAASAVHLRED